VNTKSGRLWTLLTLVLLGRFWKNWYYVFGIRKRSSTSIPNFIKIWEGGLHGLDQLMWNDPMTYVVVMSISCCRVFGAISLLWKFKKTTQTFPWWKIYLKKRSNQTWGNHKSSIIIHYNFLSNHNRLNWPKMACSSNRLHFSNLIVINDYFCN